MGGSCWSVELAQVRKGMGDSCWSIELISMEGDGWQLLVHRAHK